MSKPHFIIKNQFQKRGATYKQLLTSGEDFLADVCRRITGRRDYSVEWDNVSYNKGRMAILTYAGKAHYISFSETGNKGRNSFFQSVPSALNQCILDAGSLARPFYYFLPVNGKYQTPYHKFMYRLLNTVGITFLNQEAFLDDKVKPFASVEDLIRARDENRGKNRSNNSTYITLGEEGRVQIFAKVYGANKYESELFALASNRLTKAGIDLFEIKEGNLIELPAPSKQVLTNVCGKQLKVTVSDISLEKSEFESGDSLRSPRYVYNLLERLGPKKCALCDCDIPEMIQGAHIWSVSQIKHASGLSQQAKLAHAISGDNGLWLCENHHKMFDADVIRIQNDGEVRMRRHLTESQRSFVEYITPTMCVPSEIMSAGLIRYLKRRYAA